MASLGCSVDACTWIRWVWAPFQWSLDLRGAAVASQQGCKNMLRVSDLVVFLWEAGNLFSILAFLEDFQSPRSYMVHGLVLGCSGLVEVVRVPPLSWHQPHRLIWLLARSHWAAKWCSSSYPNRGCWFHCECSFPCPSSDPDHHPSPHHHHPGLGPHIGNRPLRFPLPTFPKTGLSFLLKGYSSAKSWSWSRTGGSCRWSWQRCIPRDQSCFHGQ